MSDIFGNIPILGNLLGGGKNDSGGLFGNLGGGLNNLFGFATDPIGTIGKGILELVLLILGGMIAWKLLNKIIDSI